MALSVFRNFSSSKEFEMQSNTSLISMSIPYMLHLHPVIVPSSESIGLENTKIEDTNSVDGSVIDGMEHIFNSYTQLRYGRDLRLNEVYLPHPIWQLKFSSVNDHNVQCSKRFL